MVDAATDIHSNRNYPEAQWLNCVLVDYLVVLLIIAYNTTAINRPNFSDTISILFTLNSTDFLKSMHQLEVLKPWRVWKTDLMSDLIDKIIKTVYKDSLSVFNIYFTKPFQGSKYFLDQVRILSISLYRMQRQLRPEVKVNGH